MSEISTRRCAVVIGGSRGIGRAVAVRLARDGLAVVLTYTSSPASADATVETITTAGGTAVAARADLADTASVEAVFALAEQRFGGVDVLVANAGISVFGPLAEVTPEEFDRVFATNTRGTFFALQQAARRLRNGGRIVAVSTGGTTAPAPATALYAGSKAAVELFCLVLAREIGGRAITVNTVSPGVTQTDGLTAPPEMLQQLVANTPLGRIGQPEDVADVIGFLVSEDGRWVTGQRIMAGGGLM